MVENQTRRKLKKLRTDNGLEFCSREFNNSVQKMVYPGIEYVVKPLSKMGLLRG